MLSFRVLALRGGIAYRGALSCFHQSCFYSKMSKPRVYVTRQVNEEALRLLQERCDVTVWPEQKPVPREELLKNVKNSEGLLCLLTDRVDKEILDAGVNLKVIATMSVGYEHLDLVEIKKRGIRVGYTPDVLTDATAELTVALLLATSRRLFEASQAARSGTWAAWSPFWMCGPGLKDSTVGIVGFGRIGQEVAKRLKAFNPKEIIFQNRSTKKEQAALIGATQVGFDQLLEKSDFVIATCALTPETKELFNIDAFKKMKSSAIFVNTSRGGVVDQDALVEALKSKQILAAGLDVMTPEPLPLDHPLFQLENCVILPHIGSASIETREQMGVMTARNLLGGLDGKEMPAELIL